MIDFHVVFVPKHRNSNTLQNLSPLAYLYVIFHHLWIYDVGSNVSVFDALSDQSNVEEG